jgi:hypothetical protein
MVIPYSSDKFGIFTAKQSRNGTVEQRMCAIVQGRRRPAALRLTPMYS